MESSAKRCRACVEKILEEFKEGVNANQDFLEDKDEHPFGLKHKDQHCL